MLMPPLSPSEFIIGFVLGGIVRGILVALCVGFALWIFVPFKIYNIWVIIFYLVSSASILSMVGLMTGIVAEKFDHQASISNFIITPLSFLSGTFYSIERLPEFWRDVVMFNPFFFMIDGFRFGFLGQSDATLILGITLLLVINILLWIICLRMVSTGYKLKS
tara:strand:- start:3529 stop:4017 length:489 start_codon:yes stop_codon:yes gene_type:complete